MPTIRLTPALRQAILAEYREFPREVVTPDVRALTAIQNGRLERDGSQRLALSPEERLALLSCLDVCAEGWTCALPYADGIGNQRRLERFLEQADDLAYQVRQMGGRP